jgi:hypothetical protein
MVCSGGSIAAGEREGSGDAVSCWCERGIHVAVSVYRLWATARRP